MGTAAARFTLLRFGTCLVEQDGLVKGQPKGAWWNVPINGYVVESAGTRFLFDAGMPRRVIERPWALFDPEGKGGDPILPVMRPRDAVDARLAEAGLKAGDLDGVITSHWHFDHAGGIADLHPTPILAQQAEIDAHKDLDPRLFWLAGEHNLRPVHGDEVLAPGVTIVSTPGHTPGHQSLLVETAQGAYLFTSDAVYTAINWNTNTPGAMVDEAQGMKSMQRLRDVAAEARATVIFSHDPVQNQELRPYPFWYG